jgi:hypothetical protein
VLQLKKARVEAVSDGCSPSRSRRWSAPVSEPDDDADLALELGDER